MKVLTEEQIEYYRGKLVENGVPVRFQENGETVDICTGEKLPKGISVIYQTVYWNFTKETAKEIAKITETKAVFSE